MNYLISVLLFFLLSCSNHSELENLITNNTHQIIYSKGSDFKNQSYCYFIFQGIIDPKEITPEKFSKYVKGATLTTKYIQNYNEWLLGEMGRLCKSIIGNKFKALDIDLNLKYMILLNQEAILLDNKDFETVETHEELHVLFSMFKLNHYRIEQKWNNESQKFKNNFKKKHPGYNFLNKSVLLREYFAYSFQKNIGKGYALIK